MSKLSKLSLTVLLLQPTLLFAFDKPSMWTSGTSTVYPVVRVYGCPNHFATNFAGFDFNRIAYQTRTAANTWFVEGGADLRLRYGGDLAANDTRCSTGSGQPGTGEILLTAEQNHGGGACNLATTFWNAGNISNAKVILHRGTVCVTGVYRNYNWDPGVDYPAWNEFDFQSVILHELGHAIGFNHSAVAGSIMLPSASPGDASIRNLSPDDIAGLQQSGASYGTMQATSIHRYTSAMGAPSSWNSEGETIADPLFGAPALAYSPVHTGHFYVGAYTRASDRAVMWGRTHGFSDWANGWASLGATSVRPPAIAANPADYSEVVVYAEPANDMLTSQMRTNGGWNSAVSVGAQSRVAPAVAFLPVRNVYVLAFAENPNGFIQTMISTDGGQSWKNRQEWPFRTFQSFGITCRALDECVVAFANGESPFGRLGYFYLGYDLWSETMYMSGFSSPDISADTYGASITTSEYSDRTQLGWRDRGFATVMTSGGWDGWPGSLDTTTWMPIATHAAPRIVYNGSWTEFTIWSTYASRYDQL
jgi:hypothetical protein